MTSDVICSILFCRILKMTPDPMEDHQRQSQNGSHFNTTGSGSEKQLDKFSQFLASPHGSTVLIIALVVALVAFVSIKITTSGKWSVNFRQQ